MRRSDRPTASSPGGDSDAPVAVRSSATAEDTEAASFASMNETYLNTRGADAVVVAVKRCWGSLFGARTIYYRSNKGLPQAEMDIAVVVQRQIRSTRAGVMFTIDPASGSPDSLVIEGAFGPGEAVVSGRVSPDRYVVDKKTLELRRRDISIKELAIEELSDGGTMTRELDADEGSHRVLSDREVQRLADVGRAIEKHYGRPQDTEWAFDEREELWMLQSRPVTATGHATADTPAGGAPLRRGLGAAPGTGSGPVRILTELGQGGALQEGECSSRASAIVTDSGGRPVTRRSFRASLASRASSGRTRQPASCGTARSSPSTLLVTPSSRAQRPRSRPACRLPPPVPQPPPRQPGRSCSSTSRSRRRWRPPPRSTLAAWASYGPS